MAKWAKTNSRKAGIPGTPCQKNFKETPKAMEGTIIGTLIKESRTTEGHFPKVFRASSIAIGIPRIIPKTVSLGATRVCRRYPIASLPNSGLVAACIWDRIGRDSSRSTILLLLEAARKRFRNELSM